MVSPWGEGDCPELYWRNRFVRPPSLGRSDAAVEFISTQSPDVAVIVPTRFYSSGDAGGDGHHAGDDGGRRDVVCQYQQQRAQSRATIEMSGQLRHVRNVLQQDLQGATCPGVTWQRPESNHGYIEIIEGPYKEGFATNLLDADPNNPTPGLRNPPTELNPEIDHATSILPSSNLPFKDPTWATDGAGLGDADDILMLTSRNEHEPFVGRIPAGLDAKGGFKDWTSDTIQSPLAEVIWFAIENPGYTDATLPDPDPTGKHFFGEPGMRTIYRRTLLIAPYLNPYLPYADPKTGLTPSGFKPAPGLLRIFPSNITVEDAIAGMIAFQDRYDLSARLEWDKDIQHWKIVANTLGDLTKRENRFGHFFYRPQKSGMKPAGREFPFA